MFKIFTFALATMAITAPAAARTRPGLGGERPAGDGVGDTMSSFLPGGGGGGGGKPGGIAGGGASSFRPSKNECREFDTADLCNNAVNSTCVWCKKDDAEGVCMPDLSSDEDGRRLKGGHYRGGGCCGVAKTEDACLDNGEIGGEDCVWFSTDVTAVSSSEVTLVDPEGRDFCSQLRCKMIAGDNDCALQKGCEWDSERSVCDEIKCRKFRTDVDCEAAGDGEACTWKTSNWGRSYCVDAP